MLTTLFLGLLLTLAAPQPAGPCGGLTISAIQGDGPASPFAGERLACVRGCVTGVTADGFFLQETEDSSINTAARGIFVFRYGTWQNPRGLRRGDYVEVRNFTVEEFYGQTELSRLSNDTRAAYDRLGRCALPPPLPLPPPLDPQADPDSVYERFEGMRVTLGFDATVTGPTARFASRFPAGDPEIALALRGSQLYGRRVFESDVPAGRGFLLLSGALGVDLPDVATLDRVSAPAITGILAYRFGYYTLLVEDPAPLRVERRPLSLPAPAALAPDEFSICSFNLENLYDPIDDGDGDAGDWAPRTAAAYRQALTRRAAVFERALGGCTIVGVQEVEGKEAVWQALAAAAGPSYDYDYYEGADERDITVGLLFDRRRVRLLRSTARQACTPVDYGVDLAHAQPPRLVPFSCPTGAYPLYDRPPYVADLAVLDAAGNPSLPLRAIVVHLKSRAGDEAVNAPRRLAQAQAVAAFSVVDNAAAPKVAVLGDFNAPLGDRALSPLAGLRNLYVAHVPPEERYSYIYKGRAEAIDHIFLSPGLDAHVLGGGAMHINADRPDTLDTGGRSSDHDPVLVRLRLTPVVAPELITRRATPAGLRMR